MLTPCMWTIAYRSKTTVNHFRRVSDFSGTFDQAVALAGRFLEVNPGSECWYLPTREAEIEGYVNAADVGNILIATGRRVSIKEVGAVPESLINEALEIAKIPFCFTCQSRHHVATPHTSHVR
jgi:hypothetical protein